MRHYPVLFSMLFLTLFIMTSCTLYPGGNVYQPSPPDRQEEALSRTSEGGKNVAGERTTLREARLNDSTSRLSAGQKISSEGMGRERDIREYAVEEESDEGESAREPKVPAQECIDEALILLNQSRELWERGELDEALAVLDQAYALTFDINNGPDITWQRDDLRVLIAKRIIEIYASRSAVAVGRQSEIPLSTADEVELEIRRFQGQERAFFLRAYRRSGVYRPMIVEYLREAGLPEELSWLPLVESGFNVKAFSPARALGLWQFIPSTGYKFGLNRDQYVDERMDPERSTRAAIAYLTELHGIFGDWQTVLAAYNCGEGRVLRVISGQQMNYLDNFWDLYQQLPGETRRYVPRFLATVRIVKDPEKYGFDLANEPLDEPLVYETVVTTKSMRLADISQHVNSSESELESLNAELRLKVTPDRAYVLKVPPGSAEVLSAALDIIPQAPRTVAPVGSVVRHHVRSGETLSTIAVRYGSSVNAIAKANNISQQHLIRAGQWLRVPVPGSRHRVAAGPASAVQHQVRSGETLSSIAARYGSSVNAIAQANNISQRHLIRAGQRLTIPAAGSVTVAAAKDGSVTAVPGSGRAETYTVKRGDSLFHLARRFDTTVTQIKRMNNLNSNLITVGQVLKMPVAGQAGGIAEEPASYVVQGGDSPYTIAKKFNISLEELLALNNLSRNDVIHPGQTLIIQR